MNKQNEKNAKIKICGIKNSKILKFLIDNSVDYFGLIFYEKSPRFVNLELAKKIINYVYNKKIIPVGVFVNKPLNEIMKIIKKTYHFNICYLTINY